MSFLISGMGRSGTKWLSEILNRSEKWTVGHEPRGAYDIVTFGWGNNLPKDIVEPFQKPYYGEVNSYLRYWLPYIPGIGKRGMLVRNIRDVITSVANRYRPFDVRQAAEIINDWRKTVMIARNFNEIELINFEWMVSDLDYLKDVFKRFGIGDVEVTEEDLKKRSNETEYPLYKSFEELPEEIRDLMR